MKALARIASLLVCAFAIFSIAGCATTAPASSTLLSNSAQWQGRLALKVLGTPVQAFAAHFELQGSAQAGKLIFTSPLGSTLARLQWDTGSALLITSGEPQRFDSLDALTRHTTGAELPVAALFGWLQGEQATAPGWEADLGDLPAGRLQARRLAPQVPVDLKIILDR